MAVKDKKRVTSKNTVEDMTMTPNERILKNITELYTTGLNTGGLKLFTSLDRLHLHSYRLPCKNELSSSSSSTSSVINDEEKEEEDVKEEVLDNTKEAETKEAYISLDRTRIGL
jgi:hypothetical protein